MTARKLGSGAKLQLSDVTVKVSRPMGIKPELIYRVLGATINETVEEDEPILLNKNGHIVQAIEQ